MKAVKFFFIFIIIVSQIINTSAQERITLSGAISIALNHNTSVIKSSNSLSTSRAAVKNAYGNLLPSLNAGAGWSWQRTSNNQSTTQIDSFGNNQIIGTSANDSRSFNLSLGGTFTLFDGFSNISSIYQSQKNLESAIYDLEKLKQDAILQTVNLFVTIINDEKVVNFQIEDLKFNKDMLDKVKEMYNLRIVANVDLYSQEYQTSNSQLGYLQSKSNFEKSKITLLNYLSKEVLKEYTFILDSAYAVNFISSISNIDSLYQVALSNRNDYQSQLAKIQSAGYQLTIARSGLFPSLTGNYGFSTSAASTGNLFESKNYNFGLSLSLPIFSHWSTEYNIESAQIQIMNSNEDMSALRRQIQSDVKNAVIDLETAKLLLDVTNDAVTSVKETWSIKKASYILGTATFIDQQLAYRDYIQATNNQIASESNYLFKQFELLSALGLLKTEE